MVNNTMRRAAAFLLCALTVAVSGGTLTVDPGTARIHAEALRATYPRPEGSPGEADAVQYITSVLTASGIEFERRSFAEYSGGHSFSTIIDVTIPGDGEDTLLIAVPLNHPEDVDADSDRSAALAAVLTVIQAASQAAKENTPALTYRFVILGAEFGDEPTYPLGTRAFLSRFFPEGNYAMLYVDASNPPLVLETGGGGTTAPEWLVRRTTEAIQSAGLAANVSPSMNPLHRIGVSSSRPQMSQYLARGIPIVMLTSDFARFTAPDVQDNAVALSQVMARWIEEFGTSVPPEWDRHYLLFQFGERLIVIPEGTYLSILLALVAATLLYAVLFRRQMGRYARTVGRNIWNLPLLFLVVFGFLSAGTYLLELFLVVRGFPTLWQYYPTAYVGLKIGLSVLLFTLIAQLIRHLPLSKNGSFYSAAALFVLFVDVLLFSALSLSVGFYFIWAFVWAFVFSLSRFRVLKALALVAAPLFLIRMAVEVLTRPELGITETILLSTRGDLLLAFMTLPFLLMLIRLDFLIRHPVKGRRSFALTLSSVVSGVVVVGLLLYVVLSTPFGDHNPQPVTVTEAVDYPKFVHSLQVESPAPLGRIDLHYGDETYEIDTNSREWSTSDSRLPDVLSVRLSSEQFLDRDRALLEIDAPVPIDYLAITLSSDVLLELYDANFPFTRSPDLRSVQIHIGRRPDLPLQVEYTVARGTYPRVSVTARSSSHPEAISVTGEDIAVRTELVVHTEFSP